jgi:ribosomal protein L16/L10AE
MATYDANLQAAVDATSVAKSTGETDLVAYLRDQLAERDIETADEAWLRHMVDKIHEDPNFMIDREPDDYERPEPQLPRE